ncbi:MAG: NTP transferase domain-containing protein [Candidatus Margulisbacteria bacterium]|nr:NTP transferase domain-containing protein [Candidatus Margulisiibacteriota bacterium]
MKRIYTDSDISSNVPLAIHPEKWTAVIPAAGLGTRLRYDKPKILYPVLDKPILEWQLAFLKPVCHHFVVVLSPDGASLVTPVLDKLVPGQYTIVIQPSARGMGDAVYCAREALKSEFSMIVWGDQPCLKMSTIEKAVRVHEYRENAVLTLPTLVRDQAYIHFERDGDERVVKVLESREGDKVPTPGETDAGLFLFSTKTLCDELEKAAQNPSLGAETQQFNFLPLFPRFDKKMGNLASLRIIDANETIGINTLDDVILAQDVLSKRQK